MQVIVWSSDVRYALDKGIIQKKVWQKITSLKNEIMAVYLN